MKGVGFIMPSDDNVKLDKQTETSPAERISGLEDSTPQETTNDQTTLTDARTDKPKKKTLTITLVIIFAITAIALVVFLLMTYLGSGSSNEDILPNEQTSENEAEYDLAGISDFDLSFLKLENNTIDKVYSPLSIKYALAMLADAADGESYSQIHDLIGDYTPRAYVNSENRSFANAMFIRDSFKDQILESYTGTIKSKFDADVIFEPFTSADPMNTWIHQKTLGIIDNLIPNSALKDDTAFILINALAIDMRWKNELQCNLSRDDDAECLYSYQYNVKFPHEKYTSYIYPVENDNSFEKINFNGQEIKAAKIGATANRYDIISELGEDYIRSTVLKAYDEWLEETKADREEHPDDYDMDFNIDAYMAELASNYNQGKNSTDFYFYDSNEEKVFAKDLREYDGSTLQYVGIMPKTGELNSYISGLTTGKIMELINGLNDAAEINSYKDGVMTEISAYIPLFDFDYDLDLTSDLKKLGITDVFDEGKANLSKLTSVSPAWIQQALHKADIDFSNDGIKAAASTAIIGGMGSAGQYKFEYEWDVPVEKIDMTFDEPFVFLIRDKSTGEVWFAGVFYGSTTE